MGGAPTGAKAAALDDVLKAALLTLAAGEERAPALLAAALSGDRVGRLGSTKYFVLPGAAVKTSEVKEGELKAGDQVVGRGPKGLFAPLTAAGIGTYLAGGAELASELDAKRAIDQVSGWPGGAESTLLVPRNFIKCCHECAL